MPYLKPNTLSATQVRDFLLSVIFCMSGLLISWYIYDQIFFYTKDKITIPNTFMNTARFIIGSIILLLSTYYMYIGTSKYYDMN